MGMASVALKGLLQRKAMTALALIGLVLGVATVVTLVSVSTGVQSIVSEATGELRGIMVMEKDASFGPMLSVIDMADVRKIEGIPGVRNACPRIIHLPKSIDDEFTDAAAMGGFGGTVMGVDPAREAQKRIGPLPTPGKIVRGRALLPSDGKSIVIGAGVAEDLKKTVGSTISIDGVRFRVVGVYETGSPQTENNILMPISEARELIGMDPGKARAAFIELDDPSQLSRMARIIEVRVSGVAAISTEQFGEMLGGMISAIESFLWAISAIAALVAGVNIINTMLMSIMEREREIGIMRATGWLRGDVIRLLATESVILGAAGGVLGLGVGAVAVFVISGILEIPMLIDFRLAWQAIAFAVAVGGLGGLYPAWRASTISPLEAIKGE